LSRSFAFEELGKLGEDGHGMLERLLIVVVSRLEVDDVESAASSSSQ
jgi:hypothetical protein